MNQEAVGETLIIQHSIELHPFITIGYGYKKGSGSLTSQADQTRLRSKVLNFGKSLDLIYEDRILTPALSIETP